MLGTVALPRDGTQSGTPPAVRLQALDANAQLVNAPITAAIGTEPRLGATGSHFYLAYRLAASPTSYQLATLSSAFAPQSMTPLHLDGTTITQATIASADSEALAVWTEPSGMPSAPDAIWMRRLCGP